MGNEDQFKAGKEEGLIVGELKVLTQAVGHLTKAMDELKAGIGSRTQALEEKVGIAAAKLLGVDKDMEAIQGSLKDLQRARNWFVGIILLAVLGAIMKLVLVQ